MDVIKAQKRGPSIEGETDKLSLKKLLAVAASASNA